MESPDDPSERKRRRNLTPEKPRKLTDTQRGRRITLAAPEAPVSASLVSSQNLPTPQKTFKPSSRKSKASSSDERASLVQETRLFPSTIQPWSRVCVHLAHHRQSKPPDGCDQKHFDCVMRFPVRHHDLGASMPGHRPEAGSYMRPNVKPREEKHMQRALKRWFPKEYCLIKGQLGDDFSYKHASNNMSSDICKALVDHVVMALQFEYSEESLERGRVFWTKSPISDDGSRFLKGERIRVYKGDRGKRRGGEEGKCGKLFYEDVFMTPRPGLPTTGTLWRKMELTSEQKLYVSYIARNITRKLEEQHTVFLNSSGAAVIKKLYNAYKHAHTRNRTSVSIFKCLAVAVAVVTRSVSKLMGDLQLDDQYLVPFIFGNPKDMDVSLIGWVVCSLKMDPEALKKLDSFTKDFEIEPMP